MRRLVFVAFASSLISFAPACKPSAPSQTQQRTADLVKASGTGKLDDVKKLLADGADPTLCLSDGIKPTLLASYGGHADVVKELLDHGASPESSNQEFETAVMVCGACAALDPEKQKASACEADGCDRITAMLLAKGASAKARDAHKKTPLMVQAQLGHTSSVKQLLAAGAPIDDVDEDGQSALFHAVANGQLDVVKALLANSKKPDLEGKNKFGSTVFLAAAGSGHLDIARLLADTGSKKDVATTDHRTPLSVAAHNGHADVVAWLLETPQNLDAADDNGWTALHHAAFGDHADVVKLLLDKGANKDAVVNVKSPNQGTSALGVAAIQGAVASAKVLLDAHADISLGPAPTAPPLILAAFAGKLDMVKLLVERGAPLEQTNPQGGTALRAAADGGHVEIVRYLLERGAKPRPKDSFGKVPADYAREKGQKEIARMLDDAK